MANLQYAKPKEILLNAPLYIQYIMKNYIDYLNAESELRADIGERFNYPSLWAAIDRLLEFRENHTIAYIELKNAGYTTDDALMFDKYLKEND